MSEFDGLNNKIVEFINNNMHSTVTIQTSMPNMLFLYNILLDHKDDPKANEILEAFDRVMYNSIKPKANALV